MSVDVGTAAAAPAGGGTAAGKGGSDGCNAAPSLRASVACVGPGVDTMVQVPDAGDEAAAGGANSADTLLASEPEVAGATADSAVAINWASAEACWSGRVLGTTERMAAVTPVDAATSAAAMAVRDTGTRDGWRIQGGVVLIELGPAWPRPAAALKRPAASPALLSLALA